MIPQAIVLDLDGTILDSRSQIALATQETRAEFGLPPASQESLFQWFGMHPKFFFAELTSKSLDLAISSFRAKIQATSSDLGVFADVVPFLSFCGDSGIRLAVATTKPSWLAKRVLIECGISYCFEHIQGTDNFLPKPQPEVFFRCLDAMNLLASQSVWSIGDRIEDVQGSNLAGLLAVGLNRDSVCTDAKEFLESGAFFVFQDLDEVRGEITREGV